ncbi:hypothetical protein B5G32_12430 [Massilimicrobiota sp. An80]|nr:hypothetical protein B5G32_12430 [Massilimicrobiota sp. An80]
MYTINNQDNKNVRNEGNKLKYLYIYNYSPHEQNLCEMEFRHIFHEDMQTKYYITNQDFDYSRSAYIRGKLNILYESACFDEIVNFIEQQNYCYYDFKVIYLKNEITHVPYQESIDKCKQIALPIAGSVNMHHPQTIFAITKIHEIWYFGIYQNDMRWNQHNDKPYSYSHSLALRDARAVVNIALGNDLSKTIVDPCCGVGTVVLEGLSMNAHIVGYDINKYVAYQARLNLEHYGYDPLLIQRCDMRTLKKTYDVCILDIPYGVYSPFTYQQQCELLEKTRDIAAELVLISHVPMQKELINIGYHMKDQAMIQKGSFQRYITHCL